MLRMHTYIYLWTYYGTLFAVSLYRGERLARMADSAVVASAPASLPRWDVAWMCWMHCSPSLDHETLHVKLVPPVILFECQALPGREMPWNQSSSDHVQCWRSHRRSAAWCRAEKCPVAEHYIADSAHSSRHYSHKEGSSSTKRSAKTRWMYGFGQR